MWPESILNYRAAPIWVTFSYLKNSSFLSRLNAFNDIFVKRKATKVKLGEHECTIDRHLKRRSSANLTLHLNLALWESLQDWLLQIVELGTVPSGTTVFDINFNSHCYWMAVNIACTITSHLLLKLKTCTGDFYCR